MARKQKKKKLKKGKFFRFIIILLLILGGLISVCLFTPFFNVSEVAVSGNTVVSSEDIMNSAGSVLGTNIFRVNTKAVKNNLAKISVIDEIKIKRRLPSRIDIMVTETSAQVIVPYMTGYVLINEYGKVIELRDDISGYTIPTVSGIEIADAKICEEIKAVDEVSYDMVMESIRLLKEKDILKLFKSLDFTNLSNFSGYTHEGLRIIFGKMTDMEYKLNFLLSILPNVAKTEGAYIDISSGTSGIYGNTLNEPTEEPTEEPKGEGGSDGSEDSEEDENTEDENSPAEGETEE